MDNLQLALLGKFRVSFGREPLPPFRTSKAQALLIYLAVEACSENDFQAGTTTSHRREALMELLWPFQGLKSAQDNLRQTLYQLRKAIPVQQINNRTIQFTASDRQTIGINRDYQIELDVEEFNNDLNEGQLESAVKLYRGDFLSDFFLTDSTEFEVWAQVHRVALRRRVLDALDRLTRDYFVHENFGKALSYAWKQLEIDDLRESAYRQVMEAQAYLGHREAALMQYEICRKRLSEEFDVEPSIEMETLVRRIKREEIPFSNKIAIKPIVETGPSKLERGIALQEPRQRLGELIQPTADFAVVFEQVLEETGTDVRNLSRLSGISIPILETWLVDQTPRPRHLDQILKVAHSLHLPARDTDGLLLAAGYASLADLKQSSNPPPANLLLDWQLEPNTLMGQRSASLLAYHNLPAATAPFLGRQLEMEELARLLRRPDLRLITIFGLGGAGKTRLALETARTLIDRFDHGVYFISLDNINSADGFWEAILNGLGVPSDGVRTPRQLVDDYLRNKQILMLLDNFEHLIPSTTEINHLLSKTQRLKILVTSRQALGLKAEQLYPIEGLSLTDGQNSPAYQLFLQTARRLTPGYDPSPIETAGIMALCAQVEGLPLAVELSATWSDVLDPKQILVRLKSSLNEVWNSAIDRSPRQKNLYDLFDYSWQTLSAEEKEASIRLSILRGSFTPAAALALIDQQTIVLKRLLQTSFIRRTSGSRLMIHSLIRQFLSEQAVSMGYNVDVLEQRFMESTLAFAAEQSSLLRQTFKASYFQNIHAEWQHIDRAWWLAVRYQRYALLETCWDLLVYFEARNTLGEGNAFFDATRKKIPSANKRMHARIDEAQAYFAGRLFEVTRALRLAQRSLTTLAELGADIQTDSAGAYARQVLLTTEFAFTQKSFSDENMNALKDNSSTFLAKYTEVTLALVKAIKDFAIGDHERATQTFHDLIGSSDPDSFTIPTFRCFLGISLKEQGLRSAARQQFGLALQRGWEIQNYTALVTATFELWLLNEGPSNVQNYEEALEALALEMGSRRTVGRVAIQNAIQYLNLGLNERAKQLTRIGLGMMWNEVDKVERTRILSVVTQAYLASGLIKTAPQLVSWLLPDTENLN